MKCRNNFRRDLLPILFFARIQPAGLGQFWRETFGAGEYGPADFFGQTFEHAAENVVMQGIDAVPVNNAGQPPGQEAG